MTIALELLGGVLLTSALIVLARWRRAEDRIFAVVLAITAAYYVIQAILGGTLFFGIHERGRPKCPCNPS